MAERPSGPRGSTCPERHDEHGGALFSYNCRRRSVLIVVEYPGVCVRELAKCFRSGVLVVIDASLLEHLKLNLSSEGPGLGDAGFPILRGGAASVDLSGGHDDSGS